MPRVRARLVCFRVSDQEYEELQTLAAKHGGNLSDLARMSLFHLLTGSNLERSVEEHLDKLEKQSRAVLFEMREVLRTKTTEPTANNPTP